MILEPRVKITNSEGVTIGEKYVHIGSSIKLRCYLEDVPSIRSNITWRHDGELIKLESDRGGIR